jgi:hypothetical protein
MTESVKQEEGGVGSKQVGWMDDMRVEAEQQA